MPTYEYHCPKCGATDSVFSLIGDYDPDSKPECIHCRVPMGRRYSPLPFQMGLEGHYNPTVGRYVTGRKDFDEGLKQASEAASERNGIPHNFQYVDMRDTEALGVTGDGLGETFRRQHHEGKPIPKLGIDTD